MSGSLGVSRSLIKAKKKRVASQLFFLRQKEKNKKVKIPKGKKPKN